MRSTTATATRSSMDGGSAGAEALLAAMVRLPAGSPQRLRLRGAVVELCLPFATGLAARFRDRGQPREDLDQVAIVGLLKAVDRYAPALGGDFAAFAAPTILGELRHHFRDRGWYIQVPRHLQELRLRVRRAQQDLAQRLGRSPTVDDLATHLRVRPADVLAALEATGAYAPRSLSEPTPRGGARLGDLLGGLDPALAAVDTAQTLGRALARLDGRERRILALRFQHDLSQAEIGARLGISQMHVSRLLAGALRTLRHYLEDTGAT